MKKEIFNVPGRIIYSRFKHRKDIGEKLPAFSITELKRLSEAVPRKNRIPKKKGKTNGN